MIYINWFHDNLPKILGVLSFLINPIFIFLVKNKTKAQVGSYKNLLILFSCFDICYSFCELMVPLGVQGNQYGFVVFISEGVFFGYPEIGQYAMSYRCGFISLSYALLIVHFVYRYLALAHPYLLCKFFKPIGISLLVSFFLLHALSWATICQYCLSSDEEVRSIISVNFLEDYGEDSRNVPMLVAFYWGVPSYIQFRSWLGIALLTVISWYAMAVYFILGYKIITRIRSLTLQRTLSYTSIRLQRQLFSALVVQTCIPIIASFLPTVISWYAPIFGIDISWWNTNVATVALSAFPFIDPLAVICLVPNYRNALLRVDGSSMDADAYGNIPTPKVNCITTV